MDFKIGRDQLRYIASTLAELGEVVISPTRKALVAHDTMSARRFAYTLPAGGKGEDIGVDPSLVMRVARRVRDEARVSVARGEIGVKTGNVAYKLRPMVAPAYMDEPATNGMGEVTLPAEELKAALDDVNATGVTTVVILIDGKEAVFRGDGPTDCRIAVPNAKVTGKGYSRLDLGLLLPCVPIIKDCAAAITLAPKGPTKILFGADMVYHQAQRL